MGLLYKKNMGEHATIVKLMFKVMDKPLRVQFMLCIFYKHDISPFVNVHNPCRLLFLHHDSPEYQGTWC